MVEKIAFEVHQWRFVFVTVTSLSYFSYCHIFLNILDNLGPNLISRDILQKKRTRAFIWHQAWWNFRLYCWRYGLFNKCANLFDRPCKLGKGLVRVRVRGRSGERQTSQTHIFGAISCYTKQKYQKQSSIRQSLFIVRQHNIHYFRGRYYNSFFGYTSKNLKSQGFYLLCSSI